MFGPLHIKLNRKTLKDAQVIILAYMTTRAVHLQLVNDKTADALNSGNAACDTLRQIYYHKTSGSEPEKMFTLMI